jgi:hypothetical protein
MKPIVFLGDALDRLRDFQSGHAEMPGSSSNAFNAVTNRMIGSQ